MSKQTLQQPLYVISSMYLTPDLFSEMSELLASGVDGGAWAWMTCGRFDNNHRSWNLIPSVYDGKWVLASGFSIT
jgi:hypothetical protein